MLSKSAIKDRFLENGLKPSSSSSYASALSTIINRMADGDLQVLEKPTEKWFSEKEFDVKFGKLKSTTQRNYLSAIIAWLKINKEVDTPLFKSLSEGRDRFNGDYERIIESGVLTPYEKSLWIEASVLGKAFEDHVLPVLERLNLDQSKKKPLSASRYDESDLTKIRDFVITAVYIYPFYDPSSNFGVLRNDLANLKFMIASKKQKIPTDGNYFVSRPGNAGQLVLSDYKTTKTHGTLEIKLPPFLSAMFKKYALFLGLKSGEQIFPGLTKSHVTAVLQRMMKKLVGKKISSQILRKVYITSRFSDEKNDREEVARSMGHSTNTQQTVYTKDV